MREVVVNLAPHAFHLLRDGDGERSTLAFGRLCEHRKRRFETVGQVAGAGVRPRDGFFALLEKAVQLVDERLHLGRVVAGDPVFAPVADHRQPGSESLQ